MKIDEPLMQQLQQAEPADRAIPVIISLKSKDQVAELQRRGVKVTRVYETITAVAATATPAQIREISQLDGVERIEFDSEVRALD